MDGILGMVVVILLFVLVILWILLPVMIYKIDTNVKAIRELLKDIHDREDVDIELQEKDIANWK